MVKQQEQNPRLIPMREVSSIAGLSKSAILARVKRGEFPAPVIAEGNLVRYDFSEVMAWRAKKFQEREQRLAIAKAAAGEKQAASA